MLNLVMAVSKEGFVARGPADDMSWTGRLDKSIFRLLTLTNPVIGMSRRSILQLPGKQLMGRIVVELSRHHMTVEEFAEKNPGAWLGAGPTLAAQALSVDVVSRVFMVHLGRQSIGLHGPKAIKDPVSPYITGPFGQAKGWRWIANIAFPEEVTVSVYERFPT